MRGKPALKTAATREKRITPADAGKTHPDSCLPKLFQDHPRGCGENRATLMKQKSRLGSPPRMRGKLPNRPRGAADAGITPADAGKTYMFSRAYATNRDHPRGCGENVTACICARVLLGSPPRMRGKLRASCSAAVQLGITPADAGKTRTLRPSRPKSEDHPRGCGENPIRDRPQERPRGSPPRMRGKRGQHHCGFFFLRITPADAGKTP